MISNMEHTMTKSALPPVDWHILRHDENALLAEATTRSFPLSDHATILVTNTMEGSKCDTWLIFEKFIGVTPSSADERIYSFVYSAARQSKALNLLRAYAWAIYRKQIGTSELPF